MQKATRARVAKAANRVVKPKAAMPVVIRNVPAGHNWGWYSREEPRMHLQSVDGDHDYKVWLEEKGKRLFQPAAVIPRQVLKSIQARVAEQRRVIEDKWVRFMLDQGWLRLHVALPYVTLAAYPATSGRFSRKIDLRTWLPPEQLSTLGPDLIALNRELAALRLWTDRTEEEVPYDVRLSTLLWQ